MRIFSGRLGLATIGRIEFAKVQSAVIPPGGTGLNTAHGSISEYYEAIGQAIKRHRGHGSVTNG